MNNVVIVDICNTIANINDQLKKRGFRTDSYPSVIPSHVWDDEKIFSDAAPIQPIVHFVQRLAQVAEIVYLTARPLDLQNITKEWLNKHQLPEAPIVFTNGQRKGECVMGLMGGSNRSAIVLEDSPSEIESILSAIPKATLFIPDWSYNRHIVGNRLAFD